MIHNVNYFQQLIQKVLITEITSRKNQSLSRFFLFMMNLLIINCYDITQHLRNFRKIERMRDSVAFN